MDQLGDILSNTKTGDSSGIGSNSSGVRRATRRVVWLVDAATSRRALRSYEFDVALNWLNVGRPLDGPRPGAIGVKAHHVFQVVRVVDQGHVLAISGNDHNAVQTRIRPTSDVIGWRPLMSYVSVLMFRCPNTGRELSTGIEMDAATFERLPDIRSQIKCLFAISIMPGQRAKRGSETQLLPPQRSPGCLSITEVLRIVRPL